MKKSKQKKVEDVVILHQHCDLLGRIFGAPHSIDAEHKNPKTQKFHDKTIKRA